MVFSSIIFAFFFLPIVILLYFLAKETYRNYILLIASILFYAYGEPKFVFVMLGSIILNYFIGIFIDYTNQKENTNLSIVFLVLSTIANLSLLFIFKYLDFSFSLINGIFHTQIPMAHIALPIGISFFTFQAMSYCIDVYRKKVPVQKNILNLALYISFFPQLIAGPIVRYSTIEKQINHRECSLLLAGQGIQRFFLGFIKKVLISNNVATVATAAFTAGAQAQTTNPLFLWLGILCYLLQLYFDFSGYSDMAIGLGKIFGFEFLENFDYPFISQSITEFWRRWHISLGQWFRDYVYFPLGGSRVSVPKHIRNLFIVWALTGIWHGANMTFIIWGLVFFVVLVIEKFIVKPEKRKNIFFKIFWRIVCILILLINFVFFNSPTLDFALNYIRGMLGIYHVPFVIDDTILYYIREYWFFILAGILSSTPIFKYIGTCMNKNKVSSYIHAMITPILYGIAFLWAVSYLILGAHNPFIYFNF